MITLVIKNNEVVDHGLEDADWSQYDDTYEVVKWAGSLPRPKKVNTEPTDTPPPRRIVLDPRTKQQKETEARVHYLRQRELAQPKESLQMIYQDMKNGTNEYVEAIDAINTLYPEPKDV